MNFTLVQRFFLILSAIAIATVGSSLSATAQTDSNIGDRGFFSPVPGGEVTGTQADAIGETGNADAEGVTRSPVAMSETLDSARLLIGTQSLSFDGDLLPEPDRPPIPDPAANPPAVAQRDDEIEVGRATRSGPSYVGAAINIGLNEDEASPLGEGSFALISKIGLARQVSLRPSVLFGDDLMLLVPVTIDFPFQDTEDTLQVNLAPYIGSGLAISTDSDNFLGFFGTVGIDRILFSRFMATAALNVGYVEEVEVGIVLGGAYTF